MHERVQMCTMEDRGRKLNRRRPHPVCPKSSMITRSGGRVVESAAKRPYLLMPTFETSRLNVPIEPTSRGRTSGS